MIKTPAIPETIMAGDWTVVIGKGLTSMTEKKLKVPLGNTKHDLAIRVHEYGHIKFSPLKKNKEVLNSKKLFLADAGVEDFRINHLITKKKICALKYALSKEQAGTIPIHPSPFMQALLYISCFHYDGLNVLKSRLDELNKDDYEFLESCMNKIKNNPIYKTGFQTAKDIVNKYKETSVQDDKNKELEKIVINVIINLPKNVLKEPSKSSENNENDSDTNESSETKNSENNNETDDKQNKNKLDKNKTVKNNTVKIKVISIGVSNKDSNRNSPINNYLQEGIQYGLLRASKDYKFIKSKPELTIIDNTNKIIHVEKKRGKSDSGMIFRHPERMFTDGLVFGVKNKPKIIGTILIDASGSMRFNREDLVEISNKSGGATISSYCAETTDDGQENKGNLFILAKDGKVITELPVDRLTNTNNIVDLEAVEWLCAQPSPKIIVTDALFTSLSKELYGNIPKINLERIDQINELCKANSITWLRNLSELKVILKKLKTGQRFVKPKHPDMLMYLKNYSSDLSDRINDYLAGKSKQ